MNVMGLRTRTDTSNPRGRYATSLAQQAFLLLACIALAVVQPAAAAQAVASASLPEGLHVWVPSGSFAASSLIKVPRYPNATFPMPPAPRTLSLTSVRNAEVSAQLVVTGAKNLDGLTASASPLVATGGHATVAPTVEIRYVGYVPVAESKPRGGGATPAEVGGDAISSNDGKPVVADPLWPWKSVNVPAHAAQPVWFTIRVPRTAAVGTYQGRIGIAVAGHAIADYALKLKVQRPVLPDPGHGGFSLNVWFNPDALASAYHVQPWSAAHWQWIQRYMVFLAHAGQRTILTAIVQHPWRAGWNGWKPQTATGYSSLVGWSFNGKGWSFDYHRFDRYVETALHAGLGPKIVAYSMLSFRGPQRLAYLDTRTGTTVSRVVTLGSPRWNAAWCAFTRSFANYLRQRGWLDHTWLGFDERPAKVIGPVMTLLHRCAPTFLRRIEVAGTMAVSHYAADLSLGWSSLQSAPNASIDARRKQGRITTFYTWAGDLHPNTLTFSPAVEARMMGWIGISRHLDGYLHWAFDDWPPDVFRNPAYGFSQGDEYLVYPGPDGPISSIRWELLKAGIADANLVEMAESRDPHSRELESAIRLAAGDPNGDTKNVQDIVRAQAMVIAILEHRP